MNYYVDSSSNEVIELGTLKYPYRTLYPIFVEILNQHSHTAREVNVYIKEGTSTYLEDSNAYFINITLVKISTYTTGANPPGMATIITTDMAQSKVSSKAAFNLVKNFTLDINSIIVGRNFTAGEIKLIGGAGNTFQVVRSSITVENIIAKRQATVKYNGLFLFLIYLQDKTLKLCKSLNIISTLANMEFYISGSIATTVDPMNILIENVYADLKDVVRSFFFLTTCNYPEAFLTPTVFFNNFTALISGTQTVSFAPQYLRYAGPGNFSGNNWNLIGMYGLKKAGQATAKVAIGPECLPDDGLIQTFEIHNLEASILNNADLSKMNVFVFEMVSPAFRKNVLNMTDMYGKDLRSAFFGLFSIVGTVNDQIYFANLVLDNYFTINNILTFRFFGKYNFYLFYL